MPALDADILVTPVTIDQPLVGVMSEKTGQRVAHARRLAVGSQVHRTAAAAPVPSGRVPKFAVIDVVSPHRTEELSQRRHAIPPAGKCVNRAAGGSPAARQAIARRGRTRPE